MIVHVLVGLPGSGKTRFRKTMQRREGWITISRDDIRKNVFGVEFDPKVEALVDGIYWETVYEVLGGTYDSVNADVCLDCTHLTKESRSDVRNLIRGTGHKIVVHEFMLDPEVSWKRKKFTRSGSVRSEMTREKFDKMVARYQPFDPETEDCDEYVIHKGRRRG